MKKPWKVIGKTNPIICTISDDENKRYVPVDLKANASLIVKAVNNFEALLEACRSAKLAMETSGLASGYGSKVYDRICQAIAKAEGR